MRPPITRQRYFRHHTRWNAHWNVTLDLEWTVTTTTDKMQAAAMVTRAPTVALTADLKRQTPPAKAGRLRNMHH